VQGRRVRRLEHQRGRLAADVGVLQSALLPELPATIGGARVTAAYRPAEGLAGGGDFFDGFELPGGRTAILVGDVAGHGREVVPTTALVRYSLRAYLEAGLEPRAALAVASDVLGPQLDGRLVTVAVAIFDPGAGRLTFACAGHWPPGLLGVPDVPVMICCSPPLGAGVPTGRRQTTLALPPGAAACLHTDGLADVLVGTDRLGMDGVAAELAAVGPQADAGELLDRVVGLSRLQPDDMAVCILTALPGGGDGAGARLETLEVDLAMLRGSRVARFLQACGVPAPEADVTLAAARELCARAGTAIIEVRMHAAGAAATVVPPPPPALPLGRPAGPAALAAAG
jgi:serine phosphatase RsbU (regulator of sigma subunit)